MENSDDSIVPSSGFVTNVMDAVRREAATPPPIPFPWKWALPGCTAFAFVLAWYLIAVVSVPSVLAPTPELAAMMVKANQFGVGWIILALLMAFAAVKLSMRLVTAKR